ncbi:hypothetical protein F7734_47915 [Scytonema sp. UIC 10036]|uniref:hypothetical protein n=1 Tax=Scytonema sp. UIC 10036 TaxID=2304196 RepID=UPI0012DA7FAB|nr:hypothetical protein [Scytonema sp. UIC 10036]MUG99601.1 hypothetical protein [Scytonema sp. UIC 10036]
MVISDLSYLDSVSEDDVILGSAGALIGASAIASGNDTATQAVTRAYTVNFGRGGSLAVAVGYANARGYGDNASAFTDVSGDADGDIEIVKGRNYSVKTGYGAYAGSVGVAIAISIL